MSRRRTALVTGAAGFLGSHLVPALATRYEQVDTVDLRPVAVCPGGEHTGDVRELLPQLDRYDTVVHLAATVSGRLGMEQAPLGVATNLAVDLAFFDFVARTRPAHAAYVSSAAVYPAASEAVAARPHQEQEVHPEQAAFGRPDGTYGWVKLTGEHLAQLIRERFDVPLVVYRPFTVYGPGQPADYPVTAIAARALAREDPLTVWGSGKQVRDLVYVQDAVAALLVTHDQPDAVGALNICTGVGTEVAEIALLAAELVGCRPQLQLEPGKPTGAPSRVGSPERLSRWYVADTTPREGLGELLGWLKKDVSALAQT